MSEPRLILLIPIALLAVASLISSKPSLSALLLLIESGLIAFFIGSKGPAILLCLFCLLVLCANLYIEKCTPKTRPAASKSNIIMGALLFFVFALALDRLIHSPADKISKNILPDELYYDTFSIICLIFTIFVMTISAFIITNIKNTDSHRLGQ